MKRRPYLDGGPFLLRQGLELVHQDAFRHGENCNRKFLAVVVGALKSEWGMSYEEEARLREREDRGGGWLEG
jgi:hypothetical protein